MSTNYYRIPKSEEMFRREQKFRVRMQEVDIISPYQIYRGFSTISVGEWETMSPWDEFIQDTNIHLGKRSVGWKFLWNWNDGKYYTNKDGLFKFIRTGRIVDEYGNEINQEEFIEMSLEWGKENGWDIETYYKENPSHTSSFLSGPHEYYLDGLRVSTCVDFS